ncbi:MAG: hypothetical protein GX604_06115 [Actinobacteria bacterium]|nr:hypothetical protein [Actinomycetota bacterium]
MILPKFEVESPLSVEEAVRLLATLKVAMPLAGGTGLIPALKLGLHNPSVLVDLESVEGLEAVDCTGAGVYMGACAPLSVVAAEPRIWKDWRALAEAAASVGGPQLRNVGTIGGNVCLDTRCWFYDRTATWRQAVERCLKRGGDVCLAAPRSQRCHAVFAADTPPALIALRGRVRTARWSAEQCIRRERFMEDLYCDEGSRGLQLDAGEIITHVIVPPVISAGEYRSGYLKYRLRRSIDFPLAAVAVGLRMADGCMRDVRVVLGGVASAPIMALEAMQELEGREPNAEVAARAAQAAARAARPVPNQATTPGQRRLMVTVLTERLLCKLTSDQYSSARRDQEAMK